MYEYGLPAIPRGAAASRSGCDAVLLRPPHGFKTYYERLRSGAFCQPGFVDSQILVIGSFFLDVCASTMGKWTIELKGLRVFSLCVFILKSDQILCVSGLGLMQRLSKKDCVFSSEQSGEEPLKRAAALESEGITKVVTINAEGTWNQTKFYSDPFNS